jgi:hypothetical protein
MNAVIEVWRIRDERHPYPWRYAVSFAGTRWIFAGIPNQCESRSEAFVLASERAAWMEDGTFNERYIAMVKEAAK